MWRHFLKSIGLLTVAMIAALYSSNAGRDGRVVGAAVSAVLALGIAIWVAIRFVPRLASNVDWEWLPLFSRYQVTRDGWIYFAALIVVVFAAVNTANNLLYMVLSGLLAILVLSGFLSALNFRSIRVHLRIPSRCFAGEAFPIAMRLHNEKRFFPSFSLRLEAPENSAFRFSAFQVQVVRALGNTSQVGQAMIKRRGLFTMPVVTATSRYPFGFFVKHRNYRIQAECICYPEIMLLKEMEFLIADLQGANERFERGLGHDLYTIRDYAPSDSARHVHWKASAKTLTLKTREYAAEESRRIVIAFDRCGHPGDTEEFEHLVSYAASLACQMTQAGIEVALVSDDWVSSPGNNQMVLDSILRYLALVKMTSAPEGPIPESAGALRLSVRSPLRGSI
jgi:uncharacterized protein (DUF58 family)